MEMDHKVNMRLSEWIAKFERSDDLYRSVDSADTGRHGMATPAAATGWELVLDDSTTGTNVASRHDDGSFPFPHRLREEAMKNILTTPQIDDIQNDTEAGCGERAEIEGQLAAQSLDQSLFLDLSRRLRRYRRSQHRPPWWDRCIRNGFR